MRILKNIQQIKSQLLNNFTKIKKSEFLRNVATLSGGTAFAQIISIGTAPILYRIYEREEYGTLGLYMAITGVLGVFSTFQYTHAILLEKEEEDAATALWLTRIINIAFTLFSFLLVLLLGDLAAKNFNNPEIKPWLYFIPISIFFSGQNDIFRVLANRQKKYKLLATNSIIVSGLVPIVSISFGYFIQGNIGLFLGLFVSQIIPTLILKYYLRTNNKFKFRQQSAQKMKLLATRHKLFPIYTLPTELINRFSAQLPVFMLGIIAGPATVGIYNLCTRMISMPVQLLSSAISEVFRQKAALQYQELGNCKQLFIKTSKSLSLIAVFPLITLIVFGPNLFSLFFGQKWRDAGVYSQILSGLYFFTFTVSPLTYMYYIAKKQKEDLYLHIIYIITTVGIFYFLGRSLNLYQTLGIYAFAYSILYLIYFFRSYQFSHGHH